MTTQGEITRLLISARGGEREALDRLFDRVYDELRQTAHRQLAGRRPGETLNTTALVHEAYLKLADGSRMELRDRRHFFAIAARAMRQIIVDYARRDRALKRGGDLIRVTIEPDELASATANDSHTAELIALNEALNQLEVLSARLAQIVELRFFGGLSIEEAGEVLDLSPRTIKRDWRKARAFLFNALSKVASP